uniref:RNase H type-1 domain-containing protein n=1 Tax=Knipowitschia caucasica TaxID=637954 RepID=A0AAV2MEB8_KNICA
MAAHTERKLEKPSHHTLSSHKRKMESTEYWKQDKWSKDLLKWLNLQVCCEHYNSPVGRTANIYTDSAYAYRTLTISIPGWIRNGFKLINGLPVKHEVFVRHLIDAVNLPSKLAIMKCRAHTQGEDMISKGNQAADQQPAAQKRQLYDSSHGTMVASKYERNGIQK